MGTAQTEGADAAGRLPWRAVKYVKIVRFIIGVKTTSDSLRSSKLIISSALRQSADLACRRPGESGVLAGWSEEADPVSPGGILLGGGGAPVFEGGWANAFPAPRVERRMDGCAAILAMPRPSRSDGLFRPRGHLFQGGELGSTG